MVTLQKHLITLRRNGSGAKFWGDMWWRKRKKSPPRIIPLSLKFLFGGISGMVSTACIHPADLVKTRMQLHGPDGAKKVSTLQVARGIVQSKGIKGLYDGLSAALFRQMVSSGARLGCFNAMFDWHMEKHGIPSFSTKVIMGSTAGIFSALMSMPSDVALIRMTADGRLPKYRRKNYKNVFNCIHRLVRVEGILVLTRGLLPTISRSMILNAAQLAAYTQAREALLPTYGDGMKLHFSASMIAGLITTVIGQPVDLIKTRYSFCFP
ncbi:hypothetical protein O3G_MSEX004980 [Manduca sexta]|uniref:Uncharacterized protein n=1 Tax=Manduca sexta TaxID=7130 RepID=A0A922CIL4_MANSE|nr:hypothetical protein O3G_MSEX004980 [Manduca sexta]